MSDKKANFIDEIAAGSEFSLPISAERLWDLQKIINQIWTYTINRNCTPLEMMLIASTFKTYADNLQGQGGED
ncbi:MAG: hypothetical protein ACE3L7_07395 [Candidatus Pristimantibacillus sp.]